MMVGGMALCHLNRETAHYVNELLNRSHWTGLNMIKHLVIFFSTSNGWELGQILKIKNLFTFYSINGAYV